jgi:hypothetical protein
MPRSGINICPLEVALCFKKNNPPILTPLPPSFLTGPIQMPRSGIQNICPSEAALQLIHFFFFGNFFTRIQHKKKPPRNFRSGFLILLLFV